VQKIEWLVLIVCLSLLWFQPEIGKLIFGWLERNFATLARRRRPSVFAIGALTIFARVVLLPWQPVPQPKVHDEFSYLLAADTFAHGRLANPPHPMWIFFDTFHVLQHPTYASMYPPAQGLALAIGKLLGQPWLGVLLSVAAMGMAFTWMLQGWMPAEWALLGGLLVWARFSVFSYWINSYWGGAIAAAGAALVLGALPRIWNQQRPRDAVFFAVGGGILAISRPFEGSIFFLPLCVVLVWWFLKQNSASRKLASRRVILPIVGILVCCAGFIGYYNWRVTGSPAVFPHFIEGRQITTAIFIWQHDKPPITYSNPQFDNFYHTFLPSMYQVSWPAAVGQWWYKSTDFWEFYLGPALSIPFLALPWILNEPRNRLLLCQVALSALGLWVVVYYHAHYAAPLMATVFLTLMLCFRELRRFHFLGRPVGVALTRLIVLFTLLIGPIYFAFQRIPQPNRAYEWIDHHPIRPLLVVLLALLLLRIGSWLLGRWVGLRTAWIVASFELLLVIGLVLHLCELQRNLYSDAFPYVDDLSEPFRAPVEKQLAAMPGEHLVLVRYSKDHNSGEEYVYNDADIDHAKTVWAREIPGVDLAPLLTYFKNRDVWLYEPDVDDATVSPYDAK
jgi:hypothetical protein